MSEISRNDPCPCGSGRKYKKCCLGKDEDAPRQERVRETILTETDLDALSNLANDHIHAGRWEEAHAACQRLRESFPEQADADDRLAQLYEAQGDWPRALTHAQAALATARQRPELFLPEAVATFEEQLAEIQAKVSSAASSTTLTPDGHVS